MGNKTFRPVVGYEHLYEVSAYGRVRSLRTGKLLAVSLNGAGYPVVHLSAGGVRRTRPVHTLILEAFVSPRPPGMVAAHLDGVRHHSVLSNLKWVTPAENQGHRRRHGTDIRGAEHPRAILTDRAVATVKQMIASGVSQRACARRFGVNASTIGAIVNGRTWRHVPVISATAGRRCAGHRPIGARGSCAVSITCVQSRASEDAVTAAAA